MSTLIDTFILDRLPIGTQVPSSVRCNCAIGAGRASFHSRGQKPEVDIEADVVVNLPQRTASSPLMSTSPSHTRNVCFFDSEMSTRHRTSPLFEWIPTTTHQKCVLIEISKNNGARDAGGRLA